MKSVLVSATLLALAVSIAAQQNAPAPDPLVKANTTVKVSDHVYVIPDGSVPLVPNVGIIVGSRATLVVDTGLGPRNGRTILAEVAKVSQNTELYVVSTHFHPEHALGESAFPATAKIIRARAQQQDIDEFGLALAETFSQRSALTKELLAGAQFRKADIFFAQAYSLDLGDVTAQILWLGPTHTRGDTGVFIPGDRVLFAGDVVMNKTFLSFASPYSSFNQWVSILGRLAALQPARIVPSHGPMGDRSLMEQSSEYLETIRNRVNDLRAQNKFDAVILEQVTSELQDSHADWAAPMRIGAAVTAMLEGR